MEGAPLDCVPANHKRSMTQMIITCSGSTSVIEARVGGHSGMRHFGDVEQEADRTLSFGGSTGAASWVHITVRDRMGKGGRNKSELFLCAQSGCQS